MLGKIFCGAAGGNNIKTEMIESPDDLSGAGLFILIPQGNKDRPLRRDLHAGCKMGFQDRFSEVRSGAHDFLPKGKLNRLIPAIERELQQAGQRRARQRAAVGG